jgi:antitoxin HigA-1
MPTKLTSRTTTKPPRLTALVQRRLPTHRPPTHPGEMLLEEFLKPLGISQSAFAIQLGVSFPRLNEVVNAKRAVTPDTALRLAQVTGMSADFWLGLQQDWDLWHAVRSAEAAEIGRLIRLPRAG